MSTRTKILIGTVVTALLIVALWTAPKVQQFLAVDDCLDRGGSWHYDIGECSFTENYQGQR